MNTKPQISDREMFLTLPVTFRLDSVTLGSSIWARYRALVRQGHAREVNDYVDRVVSHKFKDGEVKRVTMRVPRISFVHPGGRSPERAADTTPRRSRRKKRTDFDIRAGNAVYTD